MAKPIRRDRLPSTIESALSARDRVGVQDFVLLHDHTSESEFIENLKKRFTNDLIYVSGVRVRCLFAGMSEVRTLSGFVSITASFHLGQAECCGH